MPVWMITLGLVALAFAVGLLFGMFLAGPDPWQPGDERRRGA